MNSALLNRVRPVTRRFQGIRFWRSLTVVALLIAFVGWLLKRQVESGHLEGTTLALILAASFALIAVLDAIFCRLSFRNPRVVAKRIESRFPSLDQRLLTALSQRDDQLGYLQQRVVKEARDHSLTHRWIDAVPSRRLIASRLSGLAAMMLLALVLAMLAIADPITETAAALPIEKLQGVQIEPGSTEVERGTSLLVTARFDGTVPDQADLVCTADGSERRFTMTQNLNDPILGGFLPSVDRAMQYRVVTPNWQSDSFTIDVFEYPSLVRSDAQLAYPPYTGLELKRVEDTVRVSAVEGTEVTWICFLNKPVASADLVAKDGTRLRLRADAQWPGALSTSLDLRETQRWKLELLDNEGRKNKYPPELVARVLPNGPPDLKMTVAGDTSVSPLEELPIAAEVRDDYGVVKTGLSFTFAQQPPREILLGEQIPRGARSKIEHMIELEQLQAQPDQLLAYHFWAEDYGPDGKLRRTEGDMYFAEVRPFEEIYREGEQPPGGQSQQPQQGQNGQQAEQLAELQKEIINATWRVIRREPASERSSQFSEDVQLLKDSQTEAITQLEELAAKIRDAQSRTYVDEVRVQMQQAHLQLSKAESESAVAPLRPAMSAEQAAYGGLLKLRAREFQVTRRRQQQSQGQSSSSSQQRRQQQLDELELDQDENRYETQQQAEEATAAEQQQREIRQVLNRLRELARRQEDLNKELAQLQSALEKAETEEEREEIQRQLKRLRDQQQELLRETDQLNERMQRPENEERMSEASEQLDQTRENVRRASEALQQNDASGALTAGRRAEREFKEMRDEFRRQAAGQFNDTVRQMRNDAQELDERQEQLSQQLRGLDKQDDPEKSAGLRGSDPRQDVRQKLEDQRQRLAELLERMQETVEQAETAEPLLAQKLYDSYRKTQQRQVDQQLGNAAELLRRGFEPETVREAERGAGEGIDQLRQELEEAATTVLGDETKALQRALGELEQLERELDREIRGNHPDAANRDGQEPQQKQGSAGDRQDQRDRASGQVQPSDQQSLDGQGQQGDAENRQTGRGRRQTDQQDRQQSAQTQRAGQRDPSQSSQRPQEAQPSDRVSGGRPSQQQPDTRQQGQQPGQQPGQRSDQSQQGQQPGQQQGQRSGQGQQRDGQSQQNRQGSLLNRFAAENPNATAPLTGDGFRQWSDRLRDVEEMVDDPQLRSQAARIRDRARDVRMDFRRHSKEPQWELVDKMIAQPLRELKRNVSEELLRRSAEKHAPVPIDRDPVPAEYVDAVRRYYESLGSGR